MDYTVDTLRLMREMNPLARLFFIAGGDSLLYLDKWKDPGQLLSLAGFIAVYRPGCGMRKLERKRADILKRFGGEVLLVECSGLDISSSEIRRRVAAGLGISGLVPEAVEAYIRLHGLYREGA